MSSYRVFRPGQTLSDDEIQDLGLQGTYTPALQATTTSPTLGTAAVQLGDWELNAGMVQVGFTIQFGTAGTAAGSGTYRVTLPSGFGIDADWQDNRAVGTVWISDSSAGATGFYVAVLRTSSSSPDTVVMATTEFPQRAVTNAIPMTWAANDYLRGSFRYKTDFT